MLDPNDVESDRSLMDAESYSLGENSPSSSLPPGSMTALPCKSPGCSAAAAATRSSKCQPPHTSEWEHQVSVKKHGVQGWDSSDAWKEVHHETSVHSLTDSERLSGRLTLLLTRSTCRTQFAHGARSRCTPGQGVAPAGSFAPCRTSRRTSHGCSGGVGAHRIIPVTQDNSSGRGRLRNLGM